ncbi:hypothetical protein [Nostoc sp.]|uniref:hypothetical protein n=1 Tax=Nostoc sp. TaxID=1180 RepID=UPI002FF59D77
MRDGAYRSENKFVSRRSPQPPLKRGAFPDLYPLFKVVAAGGGILSETYLDVGEFEPLSLNVEPFYSDVEPLSLNVELFYSNVEPFSSNVEPFYSNVEPFSSNVEPFYSNVEPFYSNVEPFYSNVEPFYSKLDVSEHQKINYFILWDGHLAIGVNLT